MGTGRMMVEFWFTHRLEQPQLQAVGLSSRSALRRSEAWYSPSAAMIFARLSRSLSA